VPEILDSFFCLRKVGLPRICERSEHSAGSAREL